MAWNRTFLNCRANKTVWYLISNFHSRGIQQNASLRYSSDLHSANMLNRLRGIASVCQRCNCRTISYSGAKNASSDHEENKESSKLSFLEARKRGRFGSKRRLSPFQRVADLMKEDKLPTEEISQDFGEPAENSSRSVVANDDESRIGVANSVKDTNNATAENDNQYSRTATWNPQICKTSVPLSHGEYVVVLGEASKKSSMRVLIQLHKASVFDCSWGRILHGDVIGRPAGTAFETHLGHSLVIRRASLEEYVMLMKRSPTILYPKDASTVLTMADVSPGDVVLEAGTGSGAMTLFLSKAVGSSGHVVTFDSRKDHQNTGFRNCRKWKESWNVTHPDNKWPDNVSFHNTSLQHCDGLLQDDIIDTVILDVGSAGHLMPVICSKLKPGKAAIVYLPQITQTVELLDAIRAHAVPLMQETVVEVTHRSWLVKVADPCDRHVDLAESKQGNLAETTSKYLCRPQHQQFPHTGFLAHLRKVVKSSEPEE